MYLELEKIYYKDGQEAYEKEYQARFNSPAAVKLNFDIKGCPGFFVYTEDLVKLGMKIHRLDKEVRKLREMTLPLGIEHFYKKCMMDEIVLTCGIEGVYTTRREISQRIHKVQAGKRKRVREERFDGLVKQYLRLQAEEDIPLDTCQDVRNLYDELILSDVLKQDSKNRPDGQIFRKDSVDVVNLADKPIHQGLYPEAAIIVAVERALAFLKNEDVELLYRACAFHYMLEYIHPFYDGNGRLGRFIMSYSLTKELDPFIACRLSYTIMERINEYYEAFKRCNRQRNRGDITPFLLTLLNMVEISMERLCDALMARVRHLKHYLEILLPFATKEPAPMGDLYGFLLQGSLYSEDGIPMSELQAIMEKSENTVRSYLKKVEERGLLEVCQGPVLGYKLNLDAFEKIVGN